MPDQHHQMVDGMPGHMALVVVTIALILVSMFVVVLLLMRRVSDARTAPSDFISVTDLGHRLHSGSDEIRFDGIEAEDTLFILPDISHYTRFMTGTHFAFAHAQYIIFCLINAMIRAATRHVELSKLEGGAALFFVDAARHDRATVGETVTNIFGAFFTERERLKQSNVCPCRACRHIDDLDLKVFVHRGQAARFRFRGSVDLAGTDVIILHRIMKNSVDGDRYVMVTDAASGSIELPVDLAQYPVEEAVDHIGTVGAAVYVIDDEAMRRLRDTHGIVKMSRWRDTRAKLARNIRALPMAAATVLNKAIN